MAFATASTARFNNRVKNAAIQRAWRDANNRDANNNGGNLQRNAHTARMLVKKNGLQIKYGKLHYPVAEEEALRVIVHITKRGYNTHHGKNHTMRNITKFLSYLYKSRRHTGRITVSRDQWNAFKKDEQRYREGKTND